MARKMARYVYLRTNRFEVKLEAITFKTRDFECLCKMDFLFPDGKVWDCPPVVGVDVMCHPRDPSILLLLLCFGVGCVILRFREGEPLPSPILKFLEDERIHFVGFGIPEKKDLFPFEELGLTKNDVDIGYLAAKILKQPKCKTWKLSELAGKVLGVKRMIGLADASFERHEQIKCAICQLFITSIIAMGLLRANDKKKSPSLDGSRLKSSFLKNLNSLHLLAGGWFKQPKTKKRNEMFDPVEEEGDSVHVQIGEMDDMFSDHVQSSCSSRQGEPEDDVRVLVEEGDLGESSEFDDEDKESSSCNVYNRDVSCTAKMPLKGILKWPSSKFLASKPVSPSAARGGLFKRANSKGFNVSFECD